MPTKPQVLKARTAAKSRLFEVEELDLRFSNGVERTYERLASKGNGAVMIIPVLNNETLLLINEYAAGIHEYQLTLPKGLIDPGETALEAANRELMEEVGYGARRLTPLRSMTTSPSYMGHRIQVVIAEDLYPQRRPGDEPEELEVIPYPIENISELVFEENFAEARVIAALCLWQKVRKDPRLSAQLSNKTEQIS
ncbi:ADP compounds hydrolase NudE [Motiliproteus sp. MSK22-1]|uniref:ADP compounds hydrolase NudE n=1 Tax=Motiliproteus sp. MSK22-1 TaxID=1897630 RepID=UPI000978653D|nr:ADP compounds hydrolase NudE [Motiliproteus sp. MSK22-1]OMH38959.1 ADP compounds hydrolase NudE [Motiliproteus sp. MSK22-1]